MSKPVPSLEKEFDEILTDLAFGMGRFGENFKTNDVKEAKQAIIELMLSVKPEKEHAFNSVDQEGNQILGVACYCGTVLEISGKDFPRRESHRECKALKALDQWEQAIKKLGESNEQNGRLSNE